MPQLAAFVENHVIVTGVLTTVVGAEIDAVTVGGGGTVRVTACEALPPGPAHCTV
jgi:hypothetical protein